MSTDRKGPAQIYKQYLDGDFEGDPTLLFMELLEELPSVLRYTLDSPFFPMVIVTAAALAIGTIGDVNVLESKPDDKGKSAVTLQISEIAMMTMGAWLLERSSSEVGETSALLMMGISTFAQEFIEELTTNPNYVIAIIGGPLGLLAYWQAKKLVTQANRLENAIKQVRGSFALKTIQAGYTIDNKLGLRLRNNMINAGLIDLN